MPEIRQFAVEMALGGQGSGTWNRIFVLRPPSLESRTEHGFPHSHSDGCCFVNIDEM
jgi:hypothetical protein